MARDAGPGTRTEKEGKRGDIKYIYSIPWRVAFIEQPVRRAMGFRPAQKSGKCRRDPVFFKIAFLPFAAKPTGPVASIGLQYCSTAVMRGS